MSLYRAKEYPIKQESEPIEDYVKRFRNAVQEESSDRIQDFDLLQLSNVPWVDVRTFGAKGDGSTDDIKAINAAIESLQVTQAAAKTDKWMYHDCPSKGVVYFPPGHKFIISTPILCETDHSTAEARIYSDAITLWGYGAEISAASTFAGVTRDTSTAATETVTAMVLMGVKNYANNVGDWQNFNEIRGLAFSGDQVSGDIDAIHLDNVYMPVIEGCVFDNLYRCITGRVIFQAQCTNNRAIYTDCFYHQDNDSAALGWVSDAGIDASGPIINGLYALRGKNMTTDNVKYTALGKIHLVNTGEFTIGDVCIMGGGGPGIVVKNDNGATKQHHRWGRVSNVEIAGMRYHGIYVDTFQNLDFNNILLVWNHIQVNDSTCRPILLLSDVKRLNFTNLEIDQTQASGGAYNNYSSQAVLLEGGGCQFTNFRVFGKPGADATYEALRIVDGAAGYEGDFNTFTNFELGDIYYASGNKYVYGARITAGTNNNLFSNGQIRNCTTKAVHFGDNRTTNKAFNIVTDESKSVAAAGTTTLPDHGKVFTITGNTGITSITASWIDREVRLIFTGTPTVTDGSNLKLAGNFVAAGTTNDYDTLSLVCDGTNWIETSRSLN